MIWTALSTATLIGLAEIGDRSQFMCIALATRHRASTVLLGAFLAFSLMNLIAVTLGSGLGGLLSADVSLTLSGVLMLGFAVWTWFDSVDDEPEHDHAPPAGARAARPIFATMIALIISEVGDKTQLTVATLAMSDNMHPVGVWIGATLALVSTSALGVLVGRSLHDVASPALMRKVAASFFAATGLLLISVRWW